MAQPAHGERIATLETWASQHEKRCEERMDGISHLFEKIDKRFDGVDTRFSRLEVAAWALVVGIAGWLASQLWAAVT